MAKPFLHPRSKNYYARIKYWDAVSQTWKWKNQALKTDDYELAESRAEAYQDVAYAAKKLEGQTVDEEYIRSAIISFYTHAGVVITGNKEWPSIKEYLDSYLAGRKARVSKSSYKTYTTCYNAFIAWLKGNENKPLDHMTPTLANKYYEDQLEKLAVKTVNERVKFIAQAYTHAVKNIDYPSNPFAVIERAKNGKEDRLQRLPFEFEELEQLISFLYNGNARMKEWARAAIVGAAGARLVDCLMMETTALREGIIHYEQEKTGKAMAVPIVREDWLAILEEVEGDLCPQLKKNFLEVGNNRLSSEFTALVGEAGIEQKYQEFKSGRRVARKTFHSLRHSLRTFIVSSGGSDAQADLILGHSGNEGKTYTHAEMEAMREFLTKAMVRKKGKSKKSAKKKAVRAKKTS